MHHNQLLPAFLHTLFPLGHCHSRSLKNPHRLHLVSQSAIRLRRIVAGPDDPEVVEKWVHVGVVPCVPFAVFSFVLVLLLPFVGLALDLFLAVHELHFYRHLFLFYHLGLVGAVVVVSLSYFIFQLFLTGDDVFELYFK